MKIGIVLSGGGIRCVGHLAVLEVLEENDIKPVVYAGTSGGALFAALLGAGRSPGQIMEIFRQTNLLFSVKPALSLSGLLDVRKALSFALPHLPETFEELLYPLFIGTTNIQKGETVYFSSGSLTPPILASCCIPAIFKPVRIKQEDYIDGGVLNNLPAEPIVDLCDKVIGVNSNPVAGDFQYSNIKNLLERTFLLTINANLRQRKQLCDVYLEPECLKGYKVFDFKKADEIFDKTKTWTQNQIPLILKQLRE